MLHVSPLGHGIGLRSVHYSKVVETLPRSGWFEVIAENFMVRGGNPRRVLRRVREHYPVVLHGVSLSIGSTDTLDQTHLSGLRDLAHEIEPAWVSDHLCWSGLGGHHAHDLLPLPYNEESLAHVVDRIRRVQDFLGRQILVENVSSYISFRDSTMTEWEFIAALCEAADCGVLLDVNNVFVSAHNHGFDGNAYIAGIPLGRVGQIHLAGHSDAGALLIDTHDHSVPDGVWALYRKAVERFGAVSTLVEWDDEIPPFEALQEESEKAEAIERDVLGTTPHQAGRSA